MNLDIAFSDHNMTIQSLKDFGKIVAAIHRESDDPELCFWTFIRYVSINHSSILGVNLAPDLAEKCDTLLSQISLPVVTLTSPQSKIEKDNAKASRKSPWWKFWSRGARDAGD
ncbi:MAG: hypothetical protein J0M26_00835 [Planctomycetes bacterium]|nr:hypothetical protein [Planctomycetota bacterium]